MSLGSDIAAGRAYVELLLKDESFKAGLKRTSKTMEAWGKGIRGVGLGLSGAGAAILSPFAAAIPMFVQSGARLNDLSQRIGAPIDDLQRLGYAAEQSGTSLEEIMPSLIYFEKELAKSGKSGDDLVGTLMGIADELKAIDDPAKRIEFMAERFGKAGAALIPLLSGGSGELSGLFNRADRMGLVMSPEDIAAAAKMDDAYAELKGTLGALGNTLAASVIPYLQTLVELAVKTVAVVTKWIDKNRGLAAGLAATGVALLAVGTILIVLGTVVAWVATAIGGFAAALAFVISPAGGVVIAIAAVVATVLALGAGLLTITGQWENFGKAAAAYCGLAIASLDALMEYMLSSEWEKAGHVMALSIASGLKWLPGFGELLEILGFGDIEKDLAEFIRGVKLDKELREKRQKERRKELPDLGDALGGAQALVRPGALGFMNAGQARFFGTETPLGLQQRQLRQLELIREELRKLAPMRFR